MSILQPAGAPGPPAPTLPQPSPRPRATPARSGSTFNLRMCATCGHVGCCESQAGDARAHALGHRHPVILSMPVGNGFTWCYAENRYVG